MTGSFTRNLFYLCGQNVYSSRTGHIFPHCCLCHSSPFEYPDFSQYIQDLYFKLYIVGLGKLFGELQFDFVERKFSEETTEGEEEDKDDYL